jgi:hypothetical protein
MFARRLEGRSLAGIARELNERGVACPSVGDPGRNRNRSGGRWSVPTVGAILANPRYTGRQVWNRRRATDTTSRSTVVGECVVSKAVTHPALVSEADFVAAQRVRAERAVGDGARRRYRLRGLLRCGHCGRRMDAHWVHGRAGYRWRHGHRSTLSRPADAPDNLYVREDAMLVGLAARVTLDDGDAAGATSPQDALEFLRSNAMVVEVYSTTRWAVTPRN